jgi:signal transduction histidine kinase
VVSPDLPAGYGDERRLTQVLLNLVGNAIKFTYAGSVEVRAKAMDDHFILAVQDTGPGIPPEDQVRIFEDFQQVDNSINTSWRRQSSAQASASPTARKPGKGS